MTTCGMYDGAGEWLVTVGIPAKSGVSGGVLGVLPGRLGVAVFSPRLDEQGNSVRGVAVCRDLSHDLALHLIRPGERSAAPIRTTYRLGQRNSKRQRTAAERAGIRANAETTAVFELQGDLDFMAAEAISRVLLDRDEGAGARRDRPPPREPGRSRRRGLPRRARRVALRQRRQARRVGQRRGARIARDRSLRRARSRARVVRGRAAREAGPRRAHGRDRASTSIAFWTG